MTDRSESRSRPRPCPDPGLIAARAEGRLSASEAARLDAHVASCSTCSEVLAETIRFTLEEEEVEPIPERSAQRVAGALPFRQRPRFQWIAGLAAAAVLVLALGYFAWRSRPSTPAAGPLLVELAEAMGTERFVEPRLTGGFEHGRVVVLRSGERPRGLDAYPPAVLAAVARIRERAEADPSPENLGALGVTYLVSGDVPAAVKTLESATKLAPDDPRLLSDLSAAYLVRATRLDEPADLPKALDAAEKAVAQDDPPVEAWFNRALALESLHLTDAARKAWEDYLERDGSSEWADEARQHIENLTPPKRSSLEEDRARVREALREGPAFVERLANEEPSILRDYFEAALLPAWAEAQLTGQPAAVVLRDHARVIGDGLLRATGDALARDTARALERTPQAASRDPPRSQALGFQMLQDATRLYDVQKPACSVFREALRLLEEGGSPYAWRARERAIFACRYPMEPAQALAELRRVEQAAERHNYLHLLGRVRWSQGLFLWHQGELTGARERYLSARAVFRTVGDQASEAFTSMMLAESLHMLGQSHLAWSARMGSLPLLGRVRDPRRRHSILEEAALACLDELLPHCALAFQTAVVEAARPWGNAVAMSDALVRRAEMQRALGLSDEAVSDLEEARRWIPRIADQSMAARMAAEANLAEGKTLVAAEPERASTLLGRALRYFEEASPVRVPAVRLSLARAHLKRGFPTDAERELEAGIDLLETQRLSLRDVALQASFFDEAAPLFEEMVRLQVEERKDPERALFFVERGRARQLAESLGALDAAGQTSAAAAASVSNPGPRDGAPPSSELLLVERGQGRQLTDSRADTEHAGVISPRALTRPLDPEALRRALPHGVAVVEYVSLPDLLLSWIETREESHFAARHLTRDALRRHVAQYETAMEGRAPLPIVRLHAARLYDELVRPLGPAVDSARVLVFVPDAAVQAVSFASLWNRETSRYLVEDYILANAPSGTVFVRATAAVTGSGGDDATAPALVVGNPAIDREAWPQTPALAGAEIEATKIASLYGSGATLLTGPRATKEAILDALPRSRILHFAGHAVSDDRPWATRLLLAPEPATGTGDLYLRDLDDRALPHTRLVVLAACRSAAGEISPLEGSLNLARPFLAAGVPTVIASLWNVDDDVSTDFFVKLHRSLIEGADPLVALWSAQVAELRSTDPIAAHPSSWAGFVGVGGMDGHQATWPSVPLPRSARRAAVDP